MEIKIEDIVIRKGFNVRNELGDLNDLIESIKETHGVLSPILVCKISDNGKYELLAGERRLEAAKEAKYKTIDCNVKEAKNDYEKFQIMYHENLGRKELTWIERAKATKLQFDISKRFNIKLEIDLVSSRCSVCDSLIKQVEKTAISEKAPKGSLKHYKEFWMCTGCGKIYWQGRHWKKINETLARARALQTADKVNINL